MDRWMIEWMNEVDRWINIFYLLISTRTSCVIYVNFSSTNGEKEVVSFYAVFFHHLLIGKNKEVTPVIKIYYF